MQPNKMTVAKTVKATHTDRIKWGSHMSVVEPAKVEHGERFLRLRDVVAKVGLGRTTIYRMIQEGRFPPPVHPTSNTAVWPMSDLDAWIGQVKQASAEKRAVAR